MAEVGDIVFKNDGEKFVPAVLTDKTGDKDELYVLQGSSERMARRAPSDYGPEGGGETWCTAGELPDGHA